MPGRQLFDEATAFLIPPVRKILQRVDPALKAAVNEVRIRAGRPVALMLPGSTLYLRENSSATQEARDHTVALDLQDIKESFDRLCQYSVHSFVTEIKNGYFTVEGGHRVGFFGAAVLGARGEVEAMKEIGGFNVRIAREIIGAADGVFRQINESAIDSTLFVGLPGSGKTTVLRDFARQLSDRCRRKVLVIDERGEIAASLMGAPQNDVGLNTDVLHGFPKVAGILLGIRSLSPEFIVCDEIGGEAEGEALLQCIHTGVKLVASVHAGSVEEALERPFVRQLAREGAFRAVVMLGGVSRPGEIKSVVHLGDIALQKQPGAGMSGNPAARQLQRAETAAPQFPREPSSSAPREAPQNRLPAQILKGQSADSPQAGAEIRPAAQLPKALSFSSTRAPSENRPDAPVREAQRRGALSPGASVPAPESTGNRGGNTHVNAANRPADPGRRDDHGGRRADRGADVVEAGNARAVDRAAAVIAGGDPGAAVAEQNDRPRDVKIIRY